MRYVPNGIGAETPSLTYHAWDATDGNSVGSTVDTDLIGGATALSQGTNSASLTVSAVDDPLSLTLSRPTATTNNVVSASFTYQELDVDGTAGNDLVLLDNGLLLDDPDTTRTLSSVRLLFWSGYQSSEDRLELQGSSFSNGTSLINVTGSFDASDGALDLSTSSAQSEAFWQNVLRNVGYRNIDHSPSTGAREVVMLANSGGNLAIYRETTGSLPHFYEYVSDSVFVQRSGRNIANFRPAEPLTAA